MQISSLSRLSALLLLGATTAFADTVVPPPAWPSINDSPVTLAADPVRPLLLGTLRVTLDGSSLADWPISYEDLEPDYDRAEWELGVSGDPSGNARPGNVPGTTTE